MASLVKGASFMFKERTYLENKVETQYSCARL